VKIFNKENIVKLRAWDKKNKEMINDIRIAPEYGWEVFSDNDALCERGRINNSQIIFILPTTACDKNGVYIYCYDYIGISKDKYGIVYWNKTELAWWVEPIGNYPCHPLRGHTDSIIILGNKYEGFKS
jgi:hypothetical protein